MADPIELLRQQAFKLSCEDQFRLASCIATNVGYDLTPELSMNEAPALDDRVKSLETSMAHLMPDRSKNR